MTSSPIDPARIDDSIDRALADQRIVGAVVLIAQGGQTVYRRAAGLADRETGRAMTEDAIFRLSSVTKPIVSAAALALAERGVLDLNAPVTRWLPDFTPALPDGAVPAITLRHLLTHTAGLAYGFLQPADGPHHRAGVSDGLDRKVLDLDDNLARIAAAGLAYPPGQGWGYSVAIDVLGAAMQRATGKTLPQVVAETVTGPLGLSDTAFHVTDRTRLAKAYVDGKPPAPMAEPHLLPFFDLAGISFSPERIFDAAAFPSGGGGMAGAADDILTFLEAIRDGGRRIVSPETTRAMLANQTGDLPVIMGPGWGFGLGGAVLVDPTAANSRQPAGVWTWGGVYGHNWFVDPSRDLTVVALTNTAAEGMNGQFPTDLTAALYA
ncbi:penicillin-binding protein, beta-lactamase class C [Caulobacter sp. AP07]|uniref:serine hydrolase domain-containing protein n=1 Tax=Caulobacter sp. AP07 TaxID=1144304 RepID=UPI000271E87F|nr:serine hydrolase domain-containing protein [Caulobacter sp. AP07]EJL34136.1 penicillin-binding protein, beta-lactamase class C [Caulobacter sp. AP07]